MFKGASAFYQDISRWDVSSATDMNGLFMEATVFNQDISSWNVSNVNNMEDMFLVDDNMSGFLEAYVNSTEANLKLIFGLRVLVGTDKEDKTEESLKKFCKFIIFAKDKKGYEKLIKIYSDASVNGFYYTPLTDYKFLKSIWDDKHLNLCIPFYDSFIFRNVLENCVCVPELDFTEPTFFIEDNGLPFDKLLKNKVIEYAEDKKNLIKVKSTITLQAI